MNKPKVKEAIVVEGRDDTIAINAAVDAITIETHGFGIKKETWELIEKAAGKMGIIVFTDPDHAGEEIRRKILEKFPDAKQAFLAREDATKKNDIGIENASPEAIIKALEKVKSPNNDESRILFSEDDLFQAGLTGREDSKERRDMLGKILGIGYANAKGMLKKLNYFNISEEEFNEAISTIDNKRD